MDGQVASDHPAYPRPIRRGIESHARYVTRELDMLALEEKNVVEAALCTACVIGDSLVRLTRALGDDRRLRILRRLTNGDYSLQELAEYFQMPKTTLLHHLVILRSVGIVRVSPGANGKYSLRAGMPLELSRLLDRYLPASLTSSSRPTSSLR